MRKALMICAVVLTLAGIRCINVEQDVVTACVVGFLAILCLWGSLTIGNLIDNENAE